MEIAGNDLAPAVLRVSPAVARVKEKLESSGLGPVQVSGAGSTLYKLFDDKDAAVHAAGEVTRGGSSATAMVVGGPVGPQPIVSEEY